MQGRDSRLLFQRMLGVGLREAHQRNLSACEAGDGNSCWFVGDCHRHGETGCSKDPVRATDFFRRACELGIQQGCTSLAKSVLIDPGVRGGGAR